MKCYNLNLLRKHDNAPLVIQYLCTETIIIGRFSEFSKRFNNPQVFIQKLRKIPEKRDAHFDFDLSTLCVRPRCNKTIDTKTPYGKAQYDVTSYILHIRCYVQTLSWRLCRMTWRNLDVCASSSSNRYHGKLAEMTHFIILYYIFYGFLYGMRFDKCAIMYYNAFFFYNLVFICMAKYASLNLFVNIVGER